MIDILIDAGGTCASGRKYTREALEKMVEQYRDKLVYYTEFLGVQARLEDAVGRVACLTLDEDDCVMVEVAPIGDKGQLVFNEVLAGRVEMVSIGTGNIKMVDGVETVGGDYKFKGVGIQSKPKNCSNDS